MHFDAQRTEEPNAQMREEGERIAQAQREALTAFVILPPLGPRLVAAFAGYGSVRHVPLLNSGAAVADSVFSERLS